MKVEPHNQLLRFKLAWNFDWRLVGVVKQLNERYSHRAVIDEVFGSLPDGPVSSARPTSRLPQASWATFTEQVKHLRKNGVSFNYLVNTAQRIEGKMRVALYEYVGRLAETGIQRFTAGDPEVVQMLKSVDSSLHITMSLSWGIRTVSQVLQAENSGVDAIYLSGPHVNRNFALLRELLAVARVPCGLYANVNCISKCPELSNHYRLFATHQNGETLTKNDAFFAGCSHVKLRNPVEWIQMPWIRPEDVRAYAQEGAVFFKLADRLADTPMLEHIADCYLSGKSPSDLFPLIERDGAKFKPLLDRKAVKHLHVWTNGLPADFLDHFRSGDCKSDDIECSICRAVAKNSVDFGGVPAFCSGQFCGTHSIPDSLMRRSWQVDHDAVKDTKHIPVQGDPLLCQTMICKPQTQPSVTK